MTQGYRPSKWSGVTAAAPGKGMVMLIDASGGSYFFDAVFRIGHEKRAVVTEHPIQNAANITDHAYLLPSRLTLFVGMSDVMDSVIPGQWSGDSPKSVNAYSKLLDLWAARQPLKVVTRLDLYENMLIEHIGADDDVSTLYGLKARVTFQQILTAVVSTLKVSIRPNATDKVNKGTVQPQDFNKQDFINNGSILGG